MAHDITIHATWTCLSNVAWFTNVPSSHKGRMHSVSYGRYDGEEAARQGYEYGYTCTCDGFIFRGHCHHVREVEASNVRCGWNGLFDVGVEADRNDADEPCCPDCNGPVTAINVGV